MDVHIIPFLTLSLFTACTHAHDEKQQCTLSINPSAHAPPYDSASMLQTHSRVKSVEQGRRGHELAEYNVVALATHLQKTVSKIWQGFDLTADEHKELNEALYATDVRRSRQLVADPGTSKRIHVLGPPDSGTNLLVSSLQLNWGDLTTQACAEPDLCDRSLWKHSIGDENDLYDRMRRCGEPSCETEFDTDMSNAVVIIMVRSPLAQMASWKKAPYSLEPCMNREWVDMINPCWSNTSPSCFDVIEGCQPDLESDMSLHFSSSVEIYNRYVAEYLDLQKDARIGDVILLPYEDLVLTPHAAMKRIADTMGWDIPDRIRILSTSAKEHGYSRDRDEALVHLHSRSWLDEIGPQNVESICNLINTTALENIAEGTHTPDPWPYSRDCKPQKP